MSYPKTHEECLRELKRIKIDITTFSNGVHLLGVEIVLRHILELMTVLGKGYPIVSIGSGRGNFENILRILQFEVILVDPDPESFAENFKVVLKPDYCTAQQLVKEKPEIIGKCITLINWPTPECGDDDYGMDAVNLLSSLGIVYIDEIDYRRAEKGAGGDRFQKWMDDPFTLHTIMARTIMEDTGRPLSFRPRVTTLVNRHYSSTVLPSIPSTTPCKNPDFSRYKDECISDCMMRVVELAKELAKQTNNI
ncbi:MAG: hypothetical protein EBQ92_00850 [Proteobacteria bacterium]|nr:hypothetical protein [Pseudomonadota bacterium]